MDERTAALLADEEARASMAASEFDADFLQAHLTDERRKSALLGEIREAIFGAQDGLISTVAVVNFVAGASQDNYYVIVAGLATALGGIFSMAAGEYISSKSQREIFDAQIVDEREEVHERPGEAEAEVAYMFTEDGLPPDKAREVARIMADHPDVMLKTMVEKELSLAVEEPHGSPLQGGLVMGAAFGLGSIAPILPHLFLTDGAAVVVVGRADARRPVRDRRREEPLDASVLVGVRAGDPGDRRDRRRCRLLLRHRPAGSPRRPAGCGLDPLEDHPEHQDDGRGDERPGADRPRRSAPRSPGSPRRTCRAGRSARAPARR